jgi:hypothetical protein
MSDEDDRTRKNRKRALGIGATALLTAACPPAGVIVGLASFFRGARRYAQSGDIDDATDMVMSYTDASGGNKSGE